MPEALMKCTDCDEILWDCQYCGEDFENEDQIKCTLDKKDTTIHVHEGCKDEK